MIKILPNELISQIAAGEVVERPASAVKELLENSIDAGAGSVAVEIEEGGLRKIRVVDNGCGMRAVDARLAFERHATSKIERLEDLFEIGTLGFRGEALASIASISRVVMKTRAADERIGVRLEIDGGREVSFEEEACEVGTDISVFGLFQHTPARRKYMKSERTEYGHVFEMVCQIALAHPEVGFRLMRDGAVVFDLPARQSGGAPGDALKERVRALYGGQTAEALVDVRFGQSNLMISGFVGKPELARSSKKYQFLFVNGRAIENRMVAHAVKEAFHSLLMHEKHPWYLLNVQIDPGMVDVNVHPRKLEVKFVNQQEVYRAVMSCVHHALEGTMLGPRFGASGEGEMRGGGDFLPREDFQPEVFGLTQKFDAVENSAVLANYEETRQRRVFDVQGTVLRPIAQIAASYIIAESEDGLVLIDQHAAHERVRYARLMEALENEKPASQKLLTPLEMDLGASGAQIVEENLEAFEALGFEIESFGGGAGRGATFLVRAVPAGIERREPEAVVKDVITDLEKEWKESGSKAVKNVREMILTYTACRGAIKFGDRLTMMEMEALVADMEKTKHCTHCPHGRPAIVKLTFEKLEEMFKRRNF